MAELTHDAAEDGFHEIQLSGKQLVFLFMAATVVSVMIFLCGVLVGRRIHAQPVEEPAEQAAAAAAQDVAVVDPPANPGEPPPPVEDELSYHKRLEGGNQPERLKPQTRAPEPTPSPQAQAPVAAATPAAASASPNVPTAGRPGRWVVQVTALTNREQAAGVVQDLIKKGYPAFLLMPAPRTPVIYRVQIGRYNDRGEAEQISRRLAREEQYKPDIKR